VHFLGLRPKIPPPSPPTPLPDPPHYPTLMKRVSTCSEFKELSACTVLMPNIAIPDELQGKNWFAHAFAPTTCLVHKSSHNLLPKHFFTSIMQLLHNAMRKLQVWNKLLVICLSTPPRPTWGHSMQFYDQAPRTPPFINSPNKVPIDWA